MDRIDSSIIFTVHTVKADGVLHPLRTILQLQEAINSFMVAPHNFCLAVIEFVAYAVSH